jgi:NADH-ubiquinone oxidoreductase chain 5
MGSLISGLFGRKIGVNGAQFITIMSIFLSTILAVLAFLEVGFNSVPSNIKLFR